MTTDNDTIIEGNKLITEFMEVRTMEAQPLRGGDFSTLYNSSWFPKDTIPVGKPEMGVTTGLLWHKIEQLKYHSSFDWLMPVYVKCKKIFSDLYTGDKKDLQMRTLFHNLRDGILSGDCKTAFETLIIFIQWYNQKNNSTQL